MSRIAILAFGSLVWSPRDLQIKGDWQYGGPALPVEFSRIAANGRLVLTYTPGEEAMPTYSAESAFSDFGESHGQAGRTGRLPHPPYQFA